jgi:hypothetical protein
MVLVAREYSQKCHVRKVSSGFDYFLLTFACGLGALSSSFGADAEYRRAKIGELGDILAEGKWVRIRKSMFSSILSVLSNSHPSHPRANMLTLT